MRSVERLHLYKRMLTSAERAGHWCSSGDARDCVLSIVPVLLGLSRCVRCLALFLLRNSEKRELDISYLCGGHSGGCFVKLLGSSRVLMKVAGLLRMMKVFDISFLIQLRSVVAFITSPAGIVLLRSIPFRYLRLLYAPSCAAVTSR